MITLTTDLGYRDPYLARIKAKIYELTKGKIPVFDITNEISPFSLQEAAYVLSHSYRDFPEGSAHLLGVDAQSSADTPHVAMAFENHYFVGADNGIFSLLIGDRPFERLYRIQLPQLEERTFPEREVLVPVACHLASGGKLELLGEPLEYPREMINVKPQVARGGSLLHGHVIYIDRLGNVVTNLNRADFEAQRGGRPFEIRLRNNKLKTVCEDFHGERTFGEPLKGKLNPGDLFAVFNSHGLLEICLYKSDQRTVGAASSLLGLEYRDTVTIEFSE